MASDGSDDEGCPKCGWDEVETGRTTTGVKEGVVGTRGVDTYVVGTCGRCGYTEFYDVTGESVAADLFFGREYAPPGESGRSTRKSDGDICFCSICGNTFTDETAAECPSCGRTFV